MDEINQVWPQWETMELIGSGGFGKVYKAKRQVMDTVSFAAIKIIKIPQELSDVKELQHSGMDFASIHVFYEDMIKNLMTEIQIMESMKSSAHIVGIEDYQIVERKEGIGWDIFIRMELLTDLGTYMEEHPLSQEEILRLGIEMSEAIMDCEKANIIHRDIKINNIFVNKFGSFKLGDFGISKQLEKSQSVVSQKGTNMYMAPEVFRGEHYDNTVDIYSLGIMLYRLLNKGRFPFMPPYPQQIRYEDNQIAMQRRIEGEALPRIPGIPLELFQIVAKAADARKENRYQSGKEFYRALKEFQKGQESLQSVISSQDKMEKTEQVVFSKEVQKAEQGVFSRETERTEQVVFSKDAEKTEQGVFSREIEKTEQGVFLQGVPKTEQTVSSSEPANQQYDDQKTTAVFPGAQVKEGQKSNKSQTGTGGFSYGTKVSYQTPAKPEKRRTGIFIFGGVAAIIAIVVVAAFFMKEKKEPVHQVMTTVAPEITAEPTPEVTVEPTAEPTLKPTKKPVTKIAVPKLVGKNTARAKRLLKKKGLKYKVISSKYNSNYSKGKVMKQSIASGKKVKKKTVIKLTISKGKKPQVSAYIPPKVVTTPAPKVTQKPNAGKAANPAAGATKMPNPAEW